MQVMRCFISPLSAICETIYHTISTEYLQSVKLHCGAFDEHLAQTDFNILSYCEH